MMDPAQSNSTALVVPPKSAAPPAELRDIKPPVAIANPWFWAACILAAIAAALLARWGWRKWKSKRQAEAMAVPPVPAHIRAREKLMAALQLINDPPVFCTLVADIIRVYLDERFDLHAPDRTTEEFLRELRTSTVLTHVQKDMLEQFLTLCDLAKFARHEPTLKELERLHLVAAQLIDDTEPSAITPSAPPSLT